MLICILVCAVMIDLMMKAKGADDYGSSAIRD
jgi:hypothetical protein